LNETRLIGDAKEMFQTILSLLLVTIFSTIVSAGQRDITVISAGSTFIYPMLGRWMSEYRKIHPELKISYDPIGSGRGIARTLNGSVDFGASDGPVSDAELQRSGKRLLHVPVVLGAVVPAYNLPGVLKDLRFPRQVLAGIYLGNITRWNDSALARANPGANLPNKPISVLYRIDNSGTTFVWTDFLSKANPEWKRRVGVGDTVTFPVGDGVYFNEGVVREIKARPYSFGYLQSTYAIDNHLQLGSVEDSGGRFVKADCGTITAAAAAARMPPDFRVSITDLHTEGAYPISSFSWLLVPLQSEDACKRRAVVEFITWILTEGQRFAAAKFYAPLPRDVAGRALVAISEIR
jgi:phosphate transport system substrate-binding protein